MTLRKIATICLALLVVRAGSAFAAAPVAATDNVNDGDDSDFDVDLNVSNSTAFDTELYDAADDVDDGDQGGDDVAADS